MMNLELFFWAARETGDKKYYDVAVTHANRTIKNHLREDFSCYHVVDYDTITGEVRDRATAQGYADYYFLEALLRYQKIGKES